MNKTNSNIRMKLYEKYLIEQNTGFYDEIFFHKMLMLERKRTERSAKPFNLLLINVAAMEGVISKDIISKVILSITCETDITGWYKNGKIIGIVFSDSSAGNTDIIKTKLKNNFLNLTGTELKASSFVILSFPNDNNTTLPFDLHKYGYIIDPIKTNVLPTKIALKFKRLFDIIFSLIGLTILAPVFFITFIVLKLTSPGPLFFREERVGLHGKIFNIYRFRTVHISNENTIHQKYTDNNLTKSKIYDKRITFIGKLLERTSLNEVPLYINVLIGDMSIVGPRPPLPYEVEEYSEWHKLRFMEIKPGIIGLWQIDGKFGCTFDEMVRMDIKYIEKQSLLLDILLVLKTPIALFKVGRFYRSLKNLNV